ncbi:recombinase family protein [Pelosinus propionicus]|uniref:Site-specific DNA recombinase n=1 Tax=Pelosinus propionicus DSM 13327 TaxID=1123291 RepID=A0A1I4JH27_9FIRM|nr:recombinase family protein [Pelosinus propionicus]SFL65870.1 Site-specific DNA recombinase [Pelosinus propionicus DSM 13327]
MIYGYARVSTVHQANNGNSLEGQVEQLQRENCEVIIQEQYTGKTTDRPKFSELVNKLQTGDKLVVTKLDRFARNVTEGIEVVRQLFSKGVKVHVLNVGLLEDTAMGNFFLTTLLAVAELERSMIAERTQAGKEIAKTKAGFRDGRPPKYTEYQLQNAMKLLEDHSYTQVEKLTGISKSTLIREKRQQKA